MLSEWFPSPPCHMRNPLLSSLLQTAELSAARERVRDLQSRLQELEETLQMTQKELLKAQDINARLQRDLKVFLEQFKWTPRQYGVSSCKYVSSVPCIKDWWKDIWLLWRSLFPNSFIKFFIMFVCVAGKCSAKGRPGGADRYSGKALPECPEGVHFSARPQREAGGGAQEQGSPAQGMVLLMYYFLCISKTWYLCAYVWKQIRAFELTCFFFQIEAN